VVGRSGTLSCSDCSASLGIVGLDRLAGMTSDWMVVPVSPQYNGRLQQTARRQTQTLLSGMTAAL